MKLTRMIAALGAAVTSVLVVAASASAQNGFSAGPRVWFVFDNFLQQNFQDQSADELREELASGTFDTLVADADQVSLRTFGGTITVPTGLRNTQIVVTGLRGTGSTDFFTTQTGGRFVGDVEEGGRDTILTVSNQVSDYDVERTDVEVAIRRTFTTGDRLLISALAGVRYEHNDVARSGSGPWEQSRTTAEGAGGHFSGSQTVEGANTLEYYSVRAGAGVYAPVNDTHGFYVDAQLAAAYFKASELTFTASTFVDIFGEATESELVIPESTDWVLGPDFAIGYRWNVTDRVGFDSRYRSQILFSLGDKEGSRSLSDPRISHGVNLGLSYDF